MTNHAHETTPHETTPAETTPDKSGSFSRLMSKLTPGRAHDEPMQAVWNGVVIAESDDTVVVEGNHYFPADAVDPRNLRSSDHRTVCPWKGVAGYYDVVVDGDAHRNGAWYYPTPSPAARKIAGRIAFSPAVEVRRAR